MRRMVLLSPRLRKKDITVWLLAYNLNAKRFYEKCGFISDGETRIQAELIIF